MAKARKFRDVSLFDKEQSEKSNFPIVLKRKELGECLIQAVIKGYSAAEVGKNLKYHYHNLVLTDVYIRSSDGKEVMKEPKDFPNGATISINKIINGEIMRKFGFEIDLDEKPIVPVGTDKSIESKIKGAEIMLRTGILVEAKMGGSSYYRDEVSIYDESDAVEENVDDADDMDI